MRGIQFDARDGSRVVRERGEHVFPAGWPDDQHPLVFAKQVREGTPVASRLGGFPITVERHEEGDIRAPVDVDHLSGGAMRSTSIREIGLHPLNSMPLEVR